MDNVTVNLTAEKLKVVAPLIIPVVVSLTPSGKTGTISLAIILPLHSGTIFNSKLIPAVISESEYLQESAQSTTNENIEKYLSKLGVIKG